MNYKNGKDVLPPSLLKELQYYIQGELVYIPKQSNKRIGWGELSASKQMIARRNDEIFRFHSNGYSVDQLTQTYHLSTESIRKIIAKMRPKTEKPSLNPEKESVYADI